MSQPAFGDVCGAAKRTVIDWEKGVSSPTGLQLSALAAAGVDVLYVLTGQRTGAAPPAPLKPDEAALLDNYRHSPADQQRLLRETGAAFAQQQRGKRSA